MLKLLRIHIQRLMHLVKQNFYSACMLAEARNRLCCDFPFESLYFLLKKCPTVFHFPPPTDMPGCLRSFLFLLSPSQFVSEKEKTAWTFLTQQHCGQPCVPTESLLLLHVFLCRSETLVILLEAWVPGTSGISLAHCFCYI